MSNQDLYLASLSEDRTDALVTELLINTEISYE